MRPTINLATRYYINNRQLNYFVTGGMAFLLIVLAYLVITIASRYGEQKRLSNEIASLEGREKTAQSMAVNEKDYQAIVSRIKFANGIIDKKRFNWLMLFDKLEGVVPEGISLSSLDPDQKGQSLKLAGTAKNFKSLRNFLENLEESKFFTDIYLVTQVEQQITAGRNAISFTVTCKANYL